VIEFCRRVGHPRLLYVSTSAVFYREEHQYALTEDSPIGPEFVNLYAETKYAGETLLNDYEGEHCVLRPRAVFGPGDTVLFPRVLEAARKGMLPVITGQGGPVMGDLVYIDTLTDYLLRAAMAPKLAESYNITNAQPVDLQALLHDVLRRLKLPAPSWKVKVGTAMKASVAMEWVWRTLKLRGEPPLTRFGVGVFAYSKTFDPSRTLHDLGQPSVALDDGVARFIEWQEQQWSR
jgi:nucleoside-diphosphate-sugar epimerase